MPDFADFSPNVLHELRLQELRREIQKGMDSAERGTVHTEKDVWARLQVYRQEVIERQGHDRSPLL
jgi:hypothetical protein